MGNVLLVDNDLDILKTLSMCLTEAGHVVFQASTPAEAESQFEEGVPQIAVIDLRLENDDDPKDQSGLVLANKIAYRAIPKIILTRFPSTETACDSLRVGPWGFPPAVEYVAKREGSEALIQAVNKCLSLHVRVDEGLVIQFGERDLVSFTNLAQLLDPTLSGQRLVNRAAELKDLFRQLYYGRAAIRIDRSLWKSDGCVALAVFVFAPGKCVQAQVVVCGRSALVVAEADRYREHAPEAPGMSGTVLVRTCEKIHYAANVYALAGTNIESVYTLAEAYREFPEKTFKASLDHLFKSTLGAWQLGRGVPDEARDMAALYREELGFGDESIMVQEARRRVSAVIQQLPRLGVKIEEGPATLTIRFGSQSFSYPNPVSYLYDTFPVEASELLVNTPGILTGKNILTDAEGRTWLTGFAQAGPKPPLWSYSAVEAVIRFDWAESDKVPELFELEKALIVESAFTKIEAGDVECRLRKPLRMIHEVRRLAHRAGNSAWREYELGLFYHAAHRLLALNPLKPFTDRELARMAHVIIAQAMICGNLSLGGAKAKAPATPCASGIHFDHAEHAVWVEGRRVHLSIQSYELLRYLVSRKGELCTRQEIVERVLVEKYDVKDEYQRNRLNTSICRLRREIEIDPDHPQYLFNERGVGYRLVC